MKYQRRRRWRIQHESIELREEQRRINRRIHDQELAQLNTTTLQNAMNNRFRNEFSIHVLAPPRGEPPSYVDTVGIMTEDCNSDVVPSEHLLLTDPTNHSKSVSVEPIPPPSVPPPSFESSCNTTVPLLVPAPPTYRDAVV